MKIDNSTNRPAIFVYHNSLKNPSEFKEVLFGIEEEGVHCMVSNHQTSRGLNLSNEAAENSPLGVGIGVGEDGEVVLHFRKLKKDEPLFVASLEEAPYRLRALGANGARLVKGLPFKDLDVEGTTEELTKEQITEIVIKIVKMLQQNN